MQNFTTTLLTLYYKYLENETLNTKYNYYGKREMSNFTTIILILSISPLIIVRGIKRLTLNITIIAKGKCQILRQ